MEKESVNVMSKLSEFIKSLRRGKSNAQIIGELVAYGLKDTQKIKLQKQIEPIRVVVEAAYVSNPADDMYKQAKDAMDEIVKALGQ
jgi:hypothetical protein